jgi:opacity protein-like surface antigen
MAKSTFFGAVAMLVVAMAPAAMAQDAVQAPGGAYTQTYPWAVDRTGRVAAGGATGPADALAPAPVRDAYAYAGGGYVGGARSDDDFTHFGDRPVTRRTNCGLQSGATYLGPDGRWYPC